MADAATMTIKAVLLPEEIQTTLKDLTFAYTPADANDKWFAQALSLLNSKGKLFVPNLKKAFNKKGDEA